MGQSSFPAKLNLGQQFGTKWILGNATSHGVGLSLPIFWSEPSSDPNFDIYIFIAFISFGFWTGLAQWLILRQAVPVSRKWVFAVALAPSLSGTAAISLFSVFPPLLFTLPILYPLLLSLLQWRLLQQVLRLARVWIIVNLLAIAIGVIVGTLFGVVMGTSLNLQLGVCVLIGGLVYGSIYGAITNLGLEYLICRSHPLPKAKNDSGPDVPPSTGVWKVTILPTILLILVFTVWILVLPLTSATAMAALRSFPLQFPSLYILPLAFAYIYLAILIHELSHLFSGLSQGFVLRAFAIERWVLVRSGKSWRIRQTRKRFASGFVFVVPKSLQTFTRRSLMVTVAGGPIASFFLFCIGAMPLLFPSLLGNNPFVFYLVILSSFSLYMAIFNTLPLKLGYLRTDGRRFLDLARNNAQGQRFTALYGINAGIRQGIRPKDLDPALVVQSLSIPEKSVDHISGLLVAYTVALDQGKLELAGDYLDQALAINLHCPELFRGQLLLEGAYFEAHIRQQPEVARHWFERIPETAMIAPYALLRAEAALLLAEGHPEAALVKAEQGMVSIQRDRFMKGEAIANEEQLTALLQSIREAA